MSWSGDSSSSRNCGTPQNDNERIQTPCAQPGRDAPATGQKHPGRTTNCRGAVVPFVIRVSDFFRHWVLRHWVFRPAFVRSTANYGGQAFVILASQAWVGTGAYPCGLPTATNHTSNIFPGFRMLFGSRARFIFLISSSSASLDTSFMYCFRLEPMPCSPLIVPPSCFAAQ